MKKISFRPSRALAALLASPLTANKRVIAIDTIADLEAIRGTLGGMGEILFPGAQTRKEAAERWFAAASTEDLLAEFGASIQHDFPQTLTKWLALDQPVLLRERLLWLVEQAQSGNIQLGEVMAQGTGTPGVPISEACPVR